MPVSRSESRNDVTEVQLENQFELEQLQRQYRRMKNEKRNYKVETDNILRRQECEIAKLTQEHEEIEALLTVARGRYSKDFDDENVKKLQELLQKDINVQEAFLEGKYSVALLDRSINSAKEKYFEKQIIAKDIRPRHKFAMQREIRILENRVFAANVRFNNTLTKNAKLKGIIDYIAVQKMRFRELHRKLNRMFQNGKTEIDKVVESSLSSYHSCDEAQHRMTFLREKAERDLAMYNLELKDVMRIIDHDRKLRNFMSTKTEDRSDILEQAIFKRHNKRMMNLLGNLKIESMKYEEIFNKIKQVTGIKDINQLVSEFIRVEDENFAQFNYINELTTEIEALQEETKERIADMADMEKSCVQIDRKRKEILRELEISYSEICAKKQKTQEQYKRSKKTVEQLKPRIERLFKSLKCNRCAITELLGNTAGLTDDNVMSFLGIIEQRINELLQVRCIQKLKYGLEDPHKNLLIADTIFPLAPETCPPMHIKPPSIADDDDSDPLSDFLDSQPVSFKEAKALVNKGVISVRDITKDPKNQVRTIV